MANASVVIDTNSDFRRGVSVTDVELLEGDLQVTGCTAAAPDPTAALNISGAPGGAVIGGALVVSDNSMLRAVSCIGVGLLPTSLLSVSLQLYLSRRLWWMLRRRTSCGESQLAESARLSWGIQRF